MLFFILKNNTSVTYVNYCLLEASFVHGEEQMPGGREPLGPATLIYEENHVAKVAAAEWQEGGQSTAGAGVREESTINLHVYVRNTSGGDPPASNTGLAAGEVRLGMRHFPEFPFELLEP